MEKQLEEASSAGYDADCEIETEHKEYIVLTKPEEYNYDADNEDNSVEEFESQEYYVFVPYQQRPVLLIDLTGENIPPTNVARSFKRK